MTSRRITLAARPVGMPAESDFALEEAEVPEPGAGELLVRTLWLSLDPYQRGRMSSARSYARPVELGEVITAEGVGEVVESRDPRYDAGAIVVGPFGWQEHAVARAGSVRRVDPAPAPVQTALHVLGMTGLTAYFGLYDVARPLPGETVVVSAAAGAVGQVVGQLARLAGCRAVGLCSAEKTADLAGYGYEAAIDYKRGDLDDALKAACPDGVDVYFDNVGGAVSDAVIRRLALGARVAVCGLISQYNLAEPELAPRNLGFFIVKRVRMQGFLVTDYAHRFPAALAQLGRWVADGSLRYREDVVEGLEHAPRAFIGLMRGENRGKLLVKL